MEKKLKYGLIGASLKHSYSVEIHKLISEYEYELIELKEDELQAFINNAEYDGFNVTIPYKKAIINYIDELDASAELCGAVNTVTARYNGTERILKGYNTDFFGFKYLLEYNGIEVKGKKAVILGDGGTTATVKAVLNDLGIAEIIIISRRGEVNYENYGGFCADADMIINASPVGMFPNNGALLINLNEFKRLSAVVDVVYNPLITRLGFMAAERGIKYCGGLMMLVAQAEYAGKLFLQRDCLRMRTERVTEIITESKRNIVLLGMPGSGKSVIGRLLAKRLRRPFVDTDAEIEKTEGGSIPWIFEKYGEEYFRKKESEVVEKFGKQSGLVISSGGGALMNRENYYALKQNGLLIYLKRDLALLTTGGRPLSRKFSVEELYNKRKDVYKAAADITVENDSTVYGAVKKIMTAVNRGKKDND
ncbi:MAG: hypothetical protein LBQ27_04210 [Clostridiales bacterium]|jgi:shikimate dehydrogenase|nr:hypothetical protein [Clostridiales bacterium]